METSGYMYLDKIFKKNILLIQVRSNSGLTKFQKANLIGLGLSGVGSKSNLFCCESVLGMVKKVDHLVKISVD